MPQNIRANLVALTLAFCLLPMRLSAQVAYVVNLDPSTGVTEHKIDPASGVLTLVPGPFVTAGLRPLRMAVDPRGRFAYLLAAYGVNIFPYKIDPATAALRPWAPQYFADDPLCLAMEPTGRFLYADPLFSGRLVGYAIDPATTRLTNVPGSPFVAGGTCVWTDPLGRFVYQLASGGISAYTIDPGNGSLTPVAGSPFPIPAENGGAANLAVHPSGKFVYLATGSSNAPTSSHVAAYRIDAISGALTPIPLPPFSGHSADFVTADPAGRFIYLRSFGTSVDGQSFPGFFGYRVDPNSGVLTSVPGSPFPYESTHTAPLSIEPTGRFAYAPSYADNRILGYTIDAGSGALAPISGSPFTAGVAGPVWIAFRDLRPVSLSTNVKALNLPFGTENSLVVKLQAAQVSSDSGDVSKARDEMTSFINQVRALANSRQLDSRTSDLLVDSAQAVIANL